MCLLCVEILKGNLTEAEAYDALHELDVEDEHYSDVIDTILIHYGSVDPSTD